MKKITKKNKNQAKPEKPFWHYGAVVGTAHTTAALRAAGNLNAGAVDAVEIRLDALTPGARELSNISLPMILTPRCKSEGGVKDWSSEARCEAVLPLLGYAAAVDVELARVAKMGPLLSECKARGIPLIYSFHDFDATPTAAKLRAIHARACAAGGTIFKVATMLRGPGDLASLLKFIETAQGLPVSVMGMGNLGRASRIVLAVAGSVLNYGWLHRPQVSGQWPAAKLKKLIAEARG